ncbi:hypothetical protein [Barnesiella sp. ET7]|uniref:hypothetical protein n=1 Tax=Barnesiella sp. ET7 TaxID=2972460 RepID=UPI001F9E2F92|nr:hypothetical protein [Barnesiella sp. ET7]MCR8912308.1 hypothetical protein [Barnesiella sp. ET7]HJB72143.1 hypothetical protein [Candidatus Barnesiella merdigallinarum]
MLTLKQVIVESHDDLEIWSSITVWEGARQELVIQLEFTDYDDPDRETKTSATLDRDEAATLAKHLHITAEALPQALFDRYGDTSNLAVPSEVEALFQEILNFILDHGARYRLTQE